MLPMRQRPLHKRLGRCILPALPCRHVCLGLVQYRLHKLLPGHMVHGHRGCRQRHVQPVQSGSICHPGPAASQRVHGLRSRNLLHRLGRSRLPALHARHLFVSPRSADPAHMHSMPHWLVLGLWRVRVPILCCWALHRELYVALVGFHITSSSSFSLILGSAW